MALIELISGAMVTTGASLMLIGVIGLWPTIEVGEWRGPHPSLTKQRKRFSSNPPSPSGEGLGKRKETDHEREDQQTGA